MLSGALLLQPSKAGEPIRVFLKKRLARIGVAFVFWSAIYIVWSYYVDHASLSAYSITQSILRGGPYYQFWYIYLLMGLYLITPILRVVVNYSDRKLMRYFIILWFVTAFVPPLLQLITGLAVDNTLLLFGGYIGYFVLGTYLIGVDVKTKILKILLAAGVILTFLGLYMMNFPFHSSGNYYFFDGYMSMTVILASVAAFLLLSKVRRDWPGNSKPWFNRLVHAISENTLPIFFLHPLILDIINRAALGIQTSSLTMPLPIYVPIAAVPIAAVSTLFICLGLILAMKKVPVIKRLIG
jgi:surface polysaccharide O-acyltransferase-like enzyme